MASSTSSAAALLLLSAAALLSLLTTLVSAADRLYTREILEVEKSLQQDNYLFTMQTDCNLVLYDNHRAIWWTGTAGQSLSCNLVMTRNGNLVIFGAFNILWESGTNCQNWDCYLLLQKDGNVVIYDNNNAIWATGTNVGNAAVVDIPHSNGTTAASGAAQNKVKELDP